MKTSEIKLEAKEIINTLFYKVLLSDNKQDWFKVIEFIDSKILELEHGDRGNEMFIWRKVKSQITFSFGKKFIKG